jgi:fucose permease
MSRNPELTVLVVSSVFSDAFNLRCIGQGIFAFSRFLAAGLCYLGVPPRILLAICTVGATACAALTISLPNGKAPIVMGIIVFLFEAPIFPTLFAITLRGMGRHTRLTSAGLVTALCGGGVWPSVAYAIRTEQNANARVTLAIVPVLYGACAIYALGLNISPTIRNWLKPGLIGQDTSRQPSFSPSVFRHTSKGEHDVSASATSQS